LAAAGGLSDLSAPKPAQIFIFALQKKHFAINLSYHSFKKYAENKRSSSIEYADKVY
jgi:hypothetical protein